MVQVLTSSFMALPSARPCTLVELMTPKDAYRFEQNFTYEL
jgi:hypothetical protein